MANVGLYDYTGGVSSMDADDTDELQNAYKLLQAQWFLRAYCESYAVPQLQRIAAQTALNNVSNITIDALRDDDTAGAVCNAMFDGTAYSAEDEETVGKVLLDFKSYVNAAEEVYGSIFPSGCGRDRFKVATERVSLWGRHWCMTLNFYRGSRPLQQSSCLQDRLYIDELLEVFGNMEGVTPFHPILEDASTFDQLIPFSDLDFKELTDEHYASIVHPLCQHEIFWMTHDKPIIAKVHQVVGYLARGFGLVEDEGAPGEFIPNQETTELTAALEWMVSQEHRQRFESVVTQIVTFLNINARRELLMNVLTGLVLISGWAETFEDLLRDNVLPKLPSNEKLRLQRIVSIKPKRHGSSDTSGGYSSESDDFERQ